MVYIQLKGGFKLHTYIYKQQLNNLKFTSEELNELLKVKLPNPLEATQVEQVNQNLYKILNNAESSFLIDEKYEISHNTIMESWRRKTEGARSEILNRFLQVENLHILMSNGCSMYAGSKAINTEEKQEHSSLLENFTLETETAFRKEIEDTIKDLVNKRPEQALDALYQIQNMYSNVFKTNNSEAIVNELDTFIHKFKHIFVKNFVLTIDYGKNHLHKAFLKKLSSRNEKLNRVNLFTLNYDLLIEKTAEELNLHVNNGFTGFHYRTFMPSTFHIGTHLNYNDGGKINTKSVNLFKLHGSLSWEFDNTKPPYGISERQLEFNKLKSEHLQEKDIPECIIYPVQSKKSYSLDLPYSEMFRQFIEFVNKPNSCILIMGYSFLDEHVNDILTNALSNPDCNLVIFSYQSKDDKNLAPYLSNLIQRSYEDSRITLFFGNVLGDFESIVRYLIPYPYNHQNERIILDTLELLRTEVHE